MSENSELWSDGANEDGVIFGYMCMVDWQHHAGADIKGNMVYWSEEDIRHYRKCVTQCGIVKVELRAVSVVSPQNFNDLDGGGANNK